MAPTFGKTHGLDKAIAIAAKAHEGQKDKAGAPYILHPLRLMAKALERGLGMDVAVIAVLHDVLEDAETAGPKLDAEALVIAFEGAYLLDDLKGVTKKAAGEETYAEFVERSAARRVSLLVKLLDVEDHILTATTPETRGMVKSRYGKAFVKLVKAAEEHGVETGITPEEMVDVMIRVVDTQGSPAK